MMSNSLKCFLLILFAFTFSNTVLAQIDYNDPKYANYGVDAEARESNHKNYVFFCESMQMKSYEDAERRLNELLAASPAATENIYIRGRTLYLHFMKVAKTEDEKVAYMDKLMLMQDIRNKYFGNVKNRGSKVIHMTKLMDYMQHYPEEVNRIMKYADEAIIAAKGNVDAGMVAQTFNTITNAFMLDLLAPDAYLRQYEVISNALSISRDPEAAEKLKECEALFIQSGAADCTNLESIYKPMYLENPDDIELMKKIMSYLAIGNCEGDFRTMVSEKNFEINPNPSSAFTLGVTFANKNEFGKAQGYFERAIELEEDKIEKSKFALRAAATCIAGKDIKDAIKFSKIAIANDSQNGLAYYILAQAYGAASADNPCQGIAKKSVYWIIVDVLYKAKALLQDDAEQIKAINSQIASYSQHFPNTEELFYDADVKVGNTYTVNCGLISGVTKVRAAK